MYDHAGMVRASPPGSERQDAVLTKLSAVENGRMPSAPIKRCLRRGLRGSSGWSDLERKRVSYVRVEIRFTGDAPGLPQRAGEHPVRVQSRESRSILQAILKRVRSFCGRLRANSSAGRKATPHYSTACPSFLESEQSAGNVHVRIVEFGLAIATVPRRVH